ncbi:MAG TPA: ABC transporter permease [Blastocatellia bacterium]|nr:ABC transporter permease [Blastocatellia bacterium]
MKLLSRLRRILYNLSSKREVETDLSQEVDSYLDMLTARNIEAGMRPDEARRAALINLGGVEQVKERVRAVKMGHVAETVFRDLRYGMRMLINAPGFSIVAIITLALGIGANTAIFSAIDEVLLTPLPFAGEGRLAIIWQSKPAQGEAQEPLSEPNYLDIAKRSRSFAGMAAWTYRRFNLIGGDGPLDLQCGIASANMFTVLGVKPAAGRDFLPSEDKPGCAPVVMLSHKLWRERFGSQQSVVGSNVILDGGSYQVIGVLPESVRFSSLAAEVDLWMPLGLDPFKDRRYARPVSSMGVIGRLKPESSLNQAQADLDSVAAALEKAYPDDNAGWKLKVVSLGEQAVKHYKAILLVLGGVVTLVLLLACANIANLLLARARFRQREIAVRAALGATRSRLIRQLLAESTLLSTLGGAAGLLVALWGIRLIGLLPIRSNDLFIPISAHIDRPGLDARMLLFMLAITLATGLVFGIVPAIQYTRPQLSESLKDGSFSVAGGRRGNWTRRGMVAFEIAVSTALLIGAGLMLKSLWYLHESSPGFNPGGVLTMDISLPAYKYQSQEMTARFYTDLLEKVKTLPGVVSASAIDLLPMSAEDNSDAFFIEGKPPMPPGHEMQTHPRSITSGLIGAIGIRLAEGRTFTQYDDASARKVAIVNEAMAHKYFPGETVIGKRVALVEECLRYRRDGPPIVDPEMGMREIVGVAGDVKLSSLDEEPVPEMYIPFLQHPQSSMSLMIKTTAAPLSIASSVRGVVRGLDSSQPVSNVNTLSNAVAASIAQPRFGAILIALFAAIALMLGVVGVYGVVSQSVAERTHEIGIRMALGAGGRAVQGMIVREGLGPALTGAGTGILGAAGLTRFLASLLSGVSTTDPAAFILLPLFIVTVAVLASYLPARRAARVDPMTALRQD